MWLIVSLAATLLVSMVFVRLPHYRKPFRLGFLLLMLTGLSLLIFVDHVMAFLQGEEFLVWATDGWIADSTLLGIAMLLPIILCWGLIVATPLGKHINLE